jgi:hypothetical protein
MASRLNAWVDVWYTDGTYFHVISVIPNNAIIPEDKGAVWHVLHGTRDALLSVRFVQWQLVT